MKSARNFLAALVLIIAAAACDSSPIAPSAPNQNLTPVIGSGIGGG